MGDTNSLTAQPVSLVSGGNYAAASSALHTQPGSGLAASPAALGVGGPGTSNTAAAAAVLAKGQGPNGGMGGRNTGSPLPHIGMVQNPNMQVWIFLVAQFV